MTERRTDDGKRRDGERGGIYLQEQMLIWMGACFALVLVVGGLAGGLPDEFRIVPGAAVTLSTAAGVVLIGFGLYQAVTAILSRRPALDTRTFVVPFIGLFAWAAPFLVEAAFH